MNYVQSSFTHFILNFLVNRLFRVKVNNTMFSILMRSVKYRNFICLLKLNFSAEKLAFIIMYKNLFISENQIL